MAKHAPLTDVSGAWRKVGKWLSESPLSRKLPYQQKKGFLQQFRPFQYSSPVFQSSSPVHWFQTANCDTSSAKMKPIGGGFYNLSAVNWSRVASVAVCLDLNMDTLLLICCVNPQKYREPTRLFSQLWHCKMIGISSSMRQSYQFNPDCICSSLATFGSYLTPFFLYPNFIARQ